MAGEAGRPQFVLNGWDREREVHLAHLRVINPLEEPLNADRRATNIA